MKTVQKQQNVHHIGHCVASTLAYGTNDPFLTHSKQLVTSIFIIVYRKPEKNFTGQYLG